MSEIVNDIFNINSCKSMVFGASLFDTRPETGYSEGEMAADRIGREHNPQIAYQFYKDMEQLWEDSKSDDDSVMLCGTSLWLNGFAPRYEGQVIPENTTEKVAKYLSIRGLWTCDQVLRSRPDYILETLFSCFKWYETSTRIVDEAHAVDTAIGKLVRKGMVCNNWIKNQLGVRYVISIKSNKSSAYDFLYLIGGSDDILCDDMSKTALDIGQAYKSTQNLIEDAKNVAITNEIKFHSQLSDNKYVWHQHVSGEFGEEFNDHPITKARLKFRYVNRCMQSIFYIYDYLQYAKKHLKIKTLLDYKGGTPKKVSIDEVIERYGKCYNYCKTLMYMFEDIASGTL